LLTVAHGTRHVPFVCSERCAAYWAARERQEGAGAVQFAQERAHEYMQRLKDGQGDLPTYEVLNMITKKRLRFRIFSLTFEFRSFQKQKLRSCIYFFPILNFCSYYTTVYTIVPM
jgi:hypothetical protein